MLSIVATSRNDDHGGNLMHRMRLCFAGILKLAARHRLPCELILVDWNPPPDKAPLAEAVPWPETSEFCSVRVLTVPPDIHHRYRHAEGLPLYQMIAKNAAIRRARGRFVLATNIDILFSDELFAFMAGGRLEDGKMYRVDRFDTDGDIDEDDPIEAQLETALDSVLRVNARRGTWNRRSGQYSILFGTIADDPTVTNQRLPLHTNACGDFTLMSRDDWFRLRAYWELDTFSFHLDTLLCATAYHSGIEEVFLPDPMRIFHIEHESGWTPEISQARTLENWLEKNRIPRISDAELGRYLEKMETEAAPVPSPNGADWGLAADTLPEAVAVRADWDKDDRLAPVPEGVPPRQPVPNAAPGDADRAAMNKLRHGLKEVFLRDHSPANLNALRELVAQYAPTVFVDFDPGCGAAIRTVLAANDEIRAIAAGPDLGLLKRSLEVVPADARRLALRDSVLPGDGERPWKDEDRVIALVGTALWADGARAEKFLASLPPRSRVVIRDIWRSPLTLDVTSFRPFFSNRVIDDIDPTRCRCFEIADHLPRGALVGGEGTAAFLAWAEANEVEPDLPAGTHLAIVTLPERIETGGEPAPSFRFDFNPGTLWRRTGSKDDPMTRRILSLCGEAGPAYAAGDYEKAENLLLTALTLEEDAGALLPFTYQSAARLMREGDVATASRQWRQLQEHGFLYGVRSVLACCFVRLGMPEKALEIADSAGGPDFVDPGLVREIRAFVESR